MSDVKHVTWEVEAADIGSAIEIAKERVRAAGWKIRTLIGAKPLDGPEKGTYAVRLAVVRA